MAQDLEQFTTHCESVKSSKCYSIYLMNCSLYSLMRGSEEAGVVEPATGRTSEGGEEETVVTQGIHPKDTTPITGVVGESMCSEQYLGTSLYLVC